MKWMICPKYMSWMFFLLSSQHVTNIEQRTRFINKRKKLFCMTEPGAMFLASTHCNQQTGQSSETLRRFYFGNWLPFFFNGKFLSCVFLCAWVQSVCESWLVSISKATPSLLFLLMTRAIHSWQPGVASWKWLAGGCLGSWLSSRAPASVGRGPLLGYPYSTLS